MQLSLDTVLAVLASLAEDHEKLQESVGSCKDSKAAAHLCGGITALELAMAKVAALEDPARAWAYNLVAAEKRDEITARLREGVAIAQRLADAKDAAEILGKITSAGDDPHSMN